MAGGGDGHTTVIRRQGLAGRWGDRPPPRPLLLCALAVCSVAIGVVLADWSDDDGEHTATGAATCDDRFVDGIDLLVYLEPSITSVDVDRLGQRLGDDDRIGEVVYVDQEETYEEFKILFADSPRLVRNMTPDLLPPSFRLDLHDADDSIALVKELAEIQGIYDTIDRRSFEARSEILGNPRRNDC
jgi:hypothetical protein